jgi:hypothetical protein
LFLLAGGSTFKTQHENNLVFGKQSSINNFSFLNNAVKELALNMSHSSSSPENDSEDESYHDLPFDFTIQDADLDLEESNDLDVESGGDDAFDSTSESVTRSLSPATRNDTENRGYASNCYGEEPINCDQSDGRSHDSFAEHNITAYDFPPDELFATSIPTKAPAEPPLAQSTNIHGTDTTKHTFIAHKGSLKRIIHPQNHLESTTSQSVWPVYSITVDLEPINNIPDARQTPPDSISHLNHQYTQQASTTISTTQQYQILFSRTQYEQCTKLFALIDTECTSSLGPDCVKDFVCRYCPVIRKRDDALFALNSAADNNGGVSSNMYSPTLDEVWRVAVQSDHKYQQNTTLTPRLGIEGWMVFTRLLSLLSHYESQRRFASRHLQQMMRHKYSNYGHGSSSSISPRLNPNEVVVVVDNPPAGPPVPLSMRGLMEVESEMAREDKSRTVVEGWPYGSLPSMELNLDHAVVFQSGYRDDMRLRSLERRRVEIQPFSTSLEGDFILRYNTDSKNDDSKSIVVRRSYADFCWLNDILNTQKRPGHGNLCGRILPPFPSKIGTSLSKSISQYQGRPKDVSERAVAVAKSGVGVFTSVAKSFWGNYIVPVATLGTSPSSPSKIKSHKAKSSSRGTNYSPFRRDEDVPADMAKRVDRYLNYLLENQALSTSFPLNAILTVSVRC